MVNLTEYLYPWASIILYNFEFNLGKAGQTLIQALSVEVISHCQSCMVFVDLCVFSTHYNLSNDSSLYNNTCQSFRYPSL